MALILVFFFFFLFFLANKQWIGLRYWKLIYIDQLVAWEWDGLTLFCLKKKFKSGLDSISTWWWWWGSIRVLWWSLSELLMMNAISALALAASLSTLCICWCSWEIIPTTPYTGSSTRHFASKYKVSAASALRLLGSCWWYKKKIERIKKKERKNFHVSPNN